MRSGQIILIPFPFAEQTNKKVRPAVVIAETADKYKDLVVSAISSVIPAKLSHREMLLQPNETNRLRVSSVIKADRIITLKRQDVIAPIGQLSDSEMLNFRIILREMIG